MKHFITLTALSLAPLAAFATDACCTTGHCESYAKSAVKPPAHEHKAGDACCSAEAKPAAAHAGEHSHDHDNDITLSAALVAKFKISSEKVGPGKVARSTLIDSSLVKDDTIAKAPALVIQAKVSERTVSKLKAGESRLRVAPLGGQSCEALFHSVAATPADAKGFASARFILDNKNGALEAGSRAEFRLVTSEKEFPLTVPRTAIQGGKGKTFVYIEEAKGFYEKHPVVVLDSDELRSAVTGVDAGEAVVTRGESVNAALEAAHGHTHGPDGEEPGHDHADHDHDDHTGHDHAKPAPAKQS